MSTTTIQLACGTDQGLIRARNEDKVEVWPEHSLIILADGIGGNTAGQVASKVAVDATFENWQNTFANLGDGTNSFSGSLSGDLLTVAVSIANHQIYDLAHAEADLDGMGSTIIAAHFGEDTVAAVHVGDSRLYQYRDGALNQLTVDHTFAQRSYELGEVRESELSSVPGGNFLLKSLGSELTLEPDVLAIPAQPGDIFLLCSDGLSDMVSVDVIGRAIKEHSENLEQLVGTLITLANEGGGRDNIAIGIARYDAA